MKVRYLCVRKIVYNEFYRSLVCVVKIYVNSPGRAVSTFETGRRISALGNISWNKLRCCQRMVYYQNIINVEPSQYSFIFIL